MIFNSNEDLINYLIRNGVLKTEEIIKAFLKIDRKNFVGERNKFEAYGDYPLPIGEGQTISQPWTVAFMLELLEPKLGNKILDVGIGSGWTTALLAEIVGESGKVYGIEIRKNILNFGKDNISKYNFIDKKRVVLKLGDGSRGWKEFSPFDRILVSASSKDIPQSLLDQLSSNNGIMVIPDYHGIYKIIKTEEEIKKLYYEGFVFVPLVSE
jgi:protein-L-isoaspartate(D-aspartate) O-methyltransferase